MILEKSMHPRWLSNTWLLAAGPGQDCVLVEICLGCGATLQCHRFAGLGHVGRQRISFRINDNRGHAKRLTGVHNTPRDRSAVGDENLLKQVFTPGPQTPQYRTGVRSISSPKCRSAP